LTPAFALAAEEKTMNYHWKQTAYNEYTLLQPDGRALTFRDYAALCAHCKRNKINAVQA
jgi:hypothetical protein